jgi:hypothetical protein
MGLDELHAYASRPLRADEPMNLFWRTRCHSALRAAALLFASWCAQADTVTLTAVADNTLIENATGSLSNGTGDAIYVGLIPRQGFSTRRGLVRFDLSGIPAAAQVSAATLTLTLVRTQSATSQVTIHKVTEAWGEGASSCDIPCGQGAPAAANDATWLHRLYPGMNWSTAGGAFSPTVSATATVTPAVGAAFNWSDVQLAADVQSWVNSPVANAGWMIRDEVTSSSRAYASRENPVVAQRPQLTVTYTVPPPVGGGDVPLPAWALVALAAGLFGAVSRFAKR